MGVSRFDGSSWTTYNEDGWMDDNTVNAIAVDRNNVKWFGTNDGLTSFDGLNASGYKAPEGHLINNIHSLDQRATGA